MRYETYIDRIILLTLVLVSFLMLWLFHGDEKMQAFISGCILSQTAGLLTLMQGHGRTQNNIGSAVESQDKP